MKSYEEKAYSALKRIEDEPLPRSNFRDWNLAIRHV